MQRCLPSDAHWSLGWSRQLWGVGGGGQPSANDSRREKKNRKKVGARRQSCFALLWVGTASYTCTTWYIKSLKDKLQKAQYKLLRGVLNPSPGTHESKPF